jgi:uncharacterized protein (DUF1501 family)
MSDHDHEQDMPPLPQHLLDAASAGCEESRLLINRRHLLGLSAGLFAWAHMPRHAEAAGTEPRLLVVIMRGALDGLHVAAPLLDPDYAKIRGSDALTNGPYLPLTSEFGLNPVMPKFQQMFLRSEAAMVQAIAPPLMISSHFECQYNLESGLPAENSRRATSSGWLNRLLNLLPQGAAVKTDAMQIGPTPLILSGPAPVLAWSSGLRKWSPRLDDPMARLYRSANPTLADLFDRGIAIDRLANADPGSIIAGSAAPSAWEKAFRGTARLMAATNGPRIAVLDVNGWDTHSGQTAALTTRLADFDTSLDAFRTEMGEAWKTTAVVCVTEMGRRAAMNGTSGTDHGVASVAFLAGGAINGRRFFGTWPGLAKANLVNGVAVRSTTDMRAVFKGLLQDHLGVPRSLLDKDVFPQSQTVAPMQDLLKTPTWVFPPQTAAASTATAAGVGSAPSASAVRPRYTSALARFREVNGSI